MEKFNYAVARLGALIAAANLLRAEVVFPVMDECVDYGSHIHLPDSILEPANSPSRNQD